MTFSIIMPTYNSEKTIRYTLDSINNQDYPLNDVEVLVIDGGSTDKTVEIAKEYPFTRILENPHKKPEFAKAIGLKESKGKYAIFMDSDEAFKTNDVLKNREAAFEKYPEAKVLLTDERTYKHVPGIGGASGCYANSCGDPFTWFMYKPDTTVAKTYTGINVKDGIFNHFNLKNGVCNAPIADGGATSINLEYVRENYADELDSVKFASVVANKLVVDTDLFLSVDNDGIWHRSTGDFKRYLSKIKFRVINNIFSKGEAGFANREVASNKKKFLFPFYSISIIFPAIDGIKLSKDYESNTMMLHPVYCLYTTFIIAYYYALKILGKKKETTSY